MSRASAERTCFTVKLLSYSCLLKSIFKNKLKIKNVNAFCILPQPNFDFFLPKKDIY